MNLSKYSFLLLLFFVFAIGCKDDDPEPENEEELITTVIVTMHDHSTMTDYVQTFTDLDGDGGDAPVITTTDIPANKTFDVTVQFLNEQENPAEDITEEVKEEDDEHQVFFIVSGLNLTHQYEDEDGDGNPLGVDNTMESGDASTGTLRVVLRHEPDKNASGVSDGDITNAGGETDIDVTFSFDIQ